MLDTMQPCVAHRSGLFVVGADPKHHRVLRGGAFNNNQRNARVAYRNRNQPDNRNDNIGFRVVVSMLL